MVVLWFIVFSAIVVAMLVGTIATMIMTNSNWYLNWCSKIAGKYTAKCMNIDWDGLFKEKEA